MVALDIAVPWFHPCVGGVEYRVMEVASRMAARGHAIVVHTTAARPDGSPLPVGEEAMRGFQVVRYKPEVFRGNFRLFYKPAVRGAQVVEGHGYPNLVNDWLVRRHAATHGLTLELIGSTLQPARLDHRAMRWAYDAFRGVPTLKQAHLLQVMTRDEADWARARGVRTRTEEVPNGIEDAAFGTYDPGPAMAKHGLHRYVLFVGRVHAEKNPRHLVEALAKLAPEFPDLQVCITGPDQGEAAAVKARARDLGVQDRVVVTGAVPREEKYALLRGCEFLALPSDFEAQGIVLLEAWAQGKTVVASRVGGVPHIVREGVTGLLHDKRDVEGLVAQMRRLLREPDLRARMEKACEAEARAKWRWDAILPRMERMYQELAARAGR